MRTEPKQNPVRGTSESGCHSRDKGTSCPHTREADTVVAPHFLRAQSSRPGAVMKSIPGEPAPSSGDTRAQEGAARAG